MSYVPDYYRPWPDGPSFTDDRPNWFDDQVYKEQIEKEMLEEDNGKDEGAK